MFQGKELTRVAPKVFAQIPHNVRSLLQLFTRLQGFLPAFGAFATALALHGLAVSLIGPRNVGNLPFFLYLLAFLISAWCGYVPGLVITTLITCGMPYLFKPGFSVRTVDKSGVMIFMLLSVIVSGMAAARRRTEGLLRRMNKELDERVAAQTRLLSEQMAELETLYAQLPVGLAFIDGELRFLRLNDKFTSLEGHPMGRYAGAATRDIVGEELAMAIETLHGRVLANGAPVLDYEVPVAESGEAQGRFWWISCSPVTQHDRVLGVQVVLQDVTARRKAEEALSHSNASLRRANQDLEQFAYSASHDLQEPLRNVAIYSQLLKNRFEGVLGPEGDLFIRYTLQGALRMEQLVRDLLAYTELSSNPPVANAAVELVSVREAVDLALLNLDASVRESGAAITASPLPELPLPKVHLVQLFQNLIGNSIKYRKPEPVDIQISAVPDQGTGWLFAVKDNGIGIAPNYHRQVFGIFRRLHSQQAYPGTGVGLAICRRIVEQNGGRIWVESNAGEGATFFFTLPESAPSKSVGGPGRIAAARD